MKDFIPILIAVISAAVVAVTGNIGGAIIFGIVMGVASWGAIFWKPKTSDRSSAEGIPHVAHEDNSTRNGESDTRAAGTEPLNLRDIGKVLGLSVAESLNGERPAGEINLVAQANVDLSLYKFELLLLLSSSAYIAADDIIADEQQKAEVRAGFLEFWNDAANTTPQMAATRLALQERFPAYASAIRADRIPVEPSQLRVSMVSQVFAKYIAKAAGRAEPTPGEVILSMSGLPELYWDGMSVGAKHLFQISNLSIR